MTGTDFLSRLLATDIPDRLSHSVSNPLELIETYMEKEGINKEHVLPLLRTTHHTLASSCAGSGKTLALSLKVLADSYRPGSAWVGTFLRTGAEELSDRLQSLSKEIGLSSTVRVSTIHAEFLRAWNAYHGNVDLIDDALDFKLFRQVVKNDVPDYLHNDLHSFLTRFSNSLGLDTELPSSLTQYVSSPVEILQLWKSQRTSLGLWSHVDIQDALINSLRTDPDMVVFLSKRWSRIYLDEFQDISQAQYEILRGYLQGDATLVAVGDDDQTIYSWRGSDVSIISQDLLKDFNPEVITLPVNYRCPAVILDTVVPSIERNPGRLPKPLHAYKQGGVVRYHQGSIPVILGHLRRELKSLEGTDRSAVILTRTNSDGLLPALVLATSGELTYKVSAGIGVDSHNMRAAKGFLDLFRPATVASSQDIYHTLQVFKVPKVHVERVLSSAAETGASFIEKLITAELDDIEYSAPSLVGLVNSLGDRVSITDDIELLYDVSDFFREKARRHSQGDQQILATVDQLVDYCRDQEYPIVSYAIESCRILLERISHGVDNAQVMVSTVHDFKGKEADVAMIWHDSKNKFPHFLSRSPEELQEERRIHYIAFTRAREELVVFATEPGEFLEECVLPSESPVKIGGVL